MLITEYYQKTCLVDIHPFSLTSKASMWRNSRLTLQMYFASEGRKEIAIQSNNINMKLIKNFKKRW
jgi:hypothetical protein